MPHLPDIQVAAGGAWHEAPSSEASSTSCSPGDDISGEGLAHETGVIEKRSGDTGHTRPPPLPFAVSPSLPLPLPLPSPSPPDPPDVVFLLAALLDAQDLRQASLTCKALGGKQAAAYNGLSLVDEAARRLFECASEWERSCLPKHNDEGWVELYHHLLMLRSKLTFDQLVGDDWDDIQYGADRSSVCSNVSWGGSSALCSDHKMRSGRHFAFFVITGGWTIGVVRPVQIDMSDLGGGGPDGFDPGAQSLWGHLIGKRTDRWNNSNVHCCNVRLNGCFSWYDWTSHHPSSRVDGFHQNTPVGLLLDLDEGTLSIYQRGQKLATLKDGLSGEYCWYATTFRDDSSVSIERRSAPDD